VLARLGKNRARAAPLRGALWSIGAWSALHRGPPCKTTSQLCIIRRECAQLGQYRFAGCASGFRYQRRLPYTLPLRIGASLHLQPRDDVVRVSLIDRDDHDASAGRIVPVHRETVLHDINMRGSWLSRKQE